MIQEALIRNTEELAKLATEAQKEKENIAMLVEINGDLEQQNKQLQWKLIEATKQLNNTTNTLTLIQQQYDTPSIISLQDYVNQPPFQRNTNQSQL